MPEMQILGSEAFLRSVLKEIPSALLPEGIKGGDTKIMWNPNNADEVAQARQTFDNLKQKGFSIFKCLNDKGDKGEQIFLFDPSAARLIFIPPLRGGI